MAAKYKIVIQEQGNKERLWNVIDEFVHMYERFYKQKMISSHVAWFIKSAETN